MLRSDNGKATMQQSRVKWTSSQLVMTGNLNMGSQRQPGHAPGTGNEADFWSHVVSAMAPGWRAAVDPSVLSGQTSLSEIDTFIYGMCTSTGWVAVAGMSHEQASVLVQQVRSDPAREQGVSRTAINAIAGMGSMGGAAGDPGTSMAARAAMAAMATTRTLDLVMQRQGNLIGHFVYLVYTPRAGAMFGRPSFINHGEKTILSLKKLFEVAAMTIGRDLHTPGASVGEQIRAAGGLKLCKELELLTQR